MPASLPCRRVHDVRIARVDHDIRCSSVFRSGNDSFPGFSPVGRFIESAFPAIRPEGALRGNENDIAVPRIDRDTANMFRGFQADIPPTLAAIVGAVYAVTVSDTALAVAFAGADPYGRRIFWIEGNRSYRKRRFAVKNRCKCSSAVNSFPDPAGRDRNKIFFSVCRIHCETAYAA